MHCLQGAAQDVLILSVDAEPCQETSLLTPVRCGGWSSCR